MQNRIPKYPGRIKLTAIDAANGIYDLTRADEPEIEGTPLAKKLLDFAVAACGVTAGTSTAYTLDGDLVDGFTLSDGAKVNFKLHVASGAGATLNVGGTGAKPIQSFFGSGISLPAGVWITAVYSADKDAFLTVSDANTTTRIAVFTESCEVTIPENIYGPAHVLMFGGGGGMWGSGSGTYGGGGGGGYMEEFEAELTPGETYDIVIGAAGVSGSSSGGTTTFAGHSAAGGKRSTVMQNGGNGGSGGGGQGLQNTTSVGGSGQYGGGGGCGSYYNAGNSGNGGNGGTYGGGGGAHYNGTAGTGGEFGGNGGRLANGASGTDVDGMTVAFSPYFLLLCDYFGRELPIGPAKASGGTYYYRGGGGGGGFGGKGGDSANSPNTSYYPNGTGGGGGYGCKGGNGGYGQYATGGGGGGYGDDGADGGNENSAYGGGGGGFFGIAARGAGGSFGATAQSGCVCIIYRTVEV